MHKEFKIIEQKTKRLVAKFADATDNFIVEQIIIDREQHPEKYEDVEIMLIDRDKVKNIIKLGISAEKLQRENKVLRKALELACEEIENNDNGKTMTLLQIQRIKNTFGIGKNKDYKDFFIQQAKESLKDD